LIDDTTAKPAGPAPSALSSPLPLTPFLHFHHLLTSLPLYFLFSVPSSKFGILQLLCLPLLRKLPGVYPKFPFWNSSSSGQQLIPKCLIPFPLKLLRTHLRFFAPMQISTLFFSDDCALFTQKHDGAGERSQVSTLGSREGSRCRGFRVTLLTNPAGGPQQWRESPPQTQISKAYCKVSSPASPMQ
jgi:hypothetical protein